MDGKSHRRAIPKRFAVKLKEARLKSLPMMIAAFASAGALWAQGKPATGERRLRPMQSIDDAQAVAPALGKYARGASRGTPEASGAVAA
jgi:hypothetical protein